MRSWGNFFAKAAALLLLLCACVALMGLVCYSAAEPEGFESAVAEPVHAFNRSVGESLARAGASVRRFFVSAGERVSALAAGLSSEDAEDRDAGTSEALSAGEQAAGDPAEAAFLWEDGAEILTGAGVPLVYYNQTDRAWAGELYGSDPIDTYGCGPTSLAMVVSTLTEETVTPSEMARWAASEGYAVARSGSRQSIVEGTAAQYGLTCEPLDPEDAEGLEAALAGGGLTVALMGPGHFTDGGHFVVLHGVTLSGQVLVADPNSRKNSLVPWDMEIILSELSSSRNDGAPLWLVSAP